MPLIAAGTALVIVALATEVALSLQHLEARKLAERGTAVDGIIVEKLSGRYVMRLTVAYTARDRRLHSIRQWTPVGPGDRWLLLENRVRVFYDPADPDRAYVEQLARPGGSLAGSLPVASLSAFAGLVGGVLLLAGASFLRAARQLLQRGTLVPARIVRAASWKNLWLAKYEVTQDDKTQSHHGFVPPGWRPAPIPDGHDRNPAALVGPKKRGGALLLIEPSPGEF